MHALLSTASSKVITTEQSITAGVKDLNYMKGILLNVKGGLIGMSNVKLKHSHSQQHVQCESSTFTRNLGSRVILKHF